MKNFLSTMPFLRNHKEELKDFTQDMKRMAIPVLIEQASAMMVGVVSTIISSQLGPAAISAIGSIGTITMLVISVLSALSVGGTVVVAQFIGRGEEAKANRTAATALFASTILTIIMIILLLVFKGQIVASLFGSASPEVVQLAYDYLGIICYYYLPFSVTTMGLAVLRGAGDMRTPMVVSLIVNLANLILSYPLIYGFSSPAAGAGLGVRGAALSTIIAQSIGMIVVILSLVTEGRSLNLRHENFFKPHWKYLKDVLYFGLPAGAESVMFNGGKLLVQIFIMGLGTASIAANTIVNSIASFVAVGGGSFSIIATTLVGQLIGAGKKEKARTWNIAITIFCSISFLIPLAIVLPFGEVFVRLFTQDSETVKISLDLLRLYVIVCPFLHASSFSIPAGLRGAGDVVYTMVVSVISMWVLRVFMSYFLAIQMGMGVQGIWIGMYLDWLGRSIFFLPRMLGRKWLNKKTVS